MNQNIVYVGIDVDDASYHGCALNQRTVEALDFHNRPTLKGLERQLEKLRTYSGAVQLKLCHEASYVGLSLQHDLKERGYDCVVVALSGLPRRVGKSVKTDRIDSAEPAEFYANDFSTVAAAKFEQDRDLLRSSQLAPNQSLMSWTPQSGAR